MAIRLGIARVRGRKQLKLLRLYLGGYRVLRDLDIRFGPPTLNDRPASYPPTYALDFLVGVNGTGKSTVLQALADLVQKLERDAPIPFPFEMEYELGKKENKQTIKLSNLIDGESGENISSAGPLRVWVNEAVCDQLSGNLLPERVVAFTTGSEAEWAFDEELELVRGGDPDAIRDLSPFDQAIRELPGRPPRPETMEQEQLSQRSRFLLVRAQQLPIVTLCGLLTDLAEAAPYKDRRLRKALDEAKIGNIWGFSLKFRMNQGVTSTADRDIVRRMATHATRALQLGADYLLVFDLTDQAPLLSQKILEEFSDGLRLFETLAGLATARADQPPVLREVNLFLERPAPRRRTGMKRELPPMHLFEWLSDGEQSFLGRLCLFSLLGQTEALILLDEPEVHFNDYWKRQIVYLLDQALAGRQNHALISTHSSITLTDVPREDIVILDREVNYTSRSFHPSLQTFAADPSDIMVHVFNTPQASGEQSVSHIRRIIDPSSSQAPNERREALEHLLAQVGPGYWSYRIRQELVTLEPE